MIDVHFEAEQTQGTVVSSFDARIKTGEQVTLYPSPLNPEQPILKHRTTFYKVKSFSHEGHDDGSTTTRYAFWDPYTLE